MKNPVIIPLAAALLSACTAAPQPAEPCDSRATAETRALYANMFRSAERGVMFGHQDDALYGHSW
ncbi:MAG: endoglucanase, partial [Alistipes sp.]|nr:endoglucanase [Alistipes sp.]